MSTTIISQAGVVVGANAPLTGVTDVSVTGVSDVRFAGNTLVEQLSNLDVVADELTFSAPVEYIQIYNSDGVATLLATVNTVTITVPADTLIGPIKVGSTPSAVVAIAGAASTFIVSRFA